MMRVSIFPGVLALSLSTCGPRPMDTGAESESTTGDAGTLGFTQTGDPPTPTTTTTPSPTVPSTSDATTFDPSTSTPTTGLETTFGTTTADDTTTTTTDACDLVSATAPSTSATTSPGTTAGMCADPEGQPDDSTCNDPSGCGCETGKCFVIPILGGLCGECLGDEDCAGGGCTVPNPLGGLGSVCNKGEPGAGCQSDAVCQDPAAPLCKLVLSVPGIIDVATCSACRSNADCPDPNMHNCSPEYDLPGFGGQYVCKADGSAQNNTGCALDDCQGQPLGDRVCASGFCNAASVQDVLFIGVCSECRSNGDCAPGLTCSDPQVDLQSNTLIGSRCV
jgi:hypothetical protein